MTSKSGHLFCLSRSLFNQPASLVTNAPAARVNPVESGRRCYVLAARMWVRTLHTGGLMNSTRVA